MLAPTPAFAFAHAPTPVTAFALAPTPATAFAHERTMGRVAFKGMFVRKCAGGSMYNLSHALMTVKLDYKL